jgi:hypothetical protein
MASGSAAIRRATVESAAKTSSPCQATNQPVKPCRALCVIMHCLSKALTHFYDLGQTLLAHRRDDLIGRGQEPAVGCIQRTELHPKAPLHAALSTPPSQRRRNPNEKALYKSRLASGTKSFKITTSSKTEKESFCPFSS